ncbi:glycoside hydrolase family 9 protein [Marinimicrobium locisalis]|uniref:glycoside hydrolase family 9 protein n=1 Tax=Marinimicrobium locisalis TaxID=546022 RepID=UPI003221BC29
MFGAIKRSVSFLLCLVFLSGCGSSDSDSPDSESSSSEGQSSSEAKSEASSDGLSSSSEASSESSSAASEASSTSEQSSSGSTSSASGADSDIRVNQLGFLPQSQKLAVVPDVEASAFALVDHQSGETVYEGNLSTALEWSPAGESISLADFSGWVEPGDYVVRVEGVGDSHPFAIGSDVYDSLNDAALKAYYFNRASTALSETHAGEYARPMGHPDTSVLVHSSAVDGSRSEGDTIPAPKGWYDAGDFGKYVVNSGISTYTLLAAYEHFPEYYTGKDVNIPESDNGRADILDEALWNLSWMLQMQDEDGGVYHKLTTLNFAGIVMPHEATADRYVIGKGTAATLNFAATMAMASRVYEPLDQTLSDSMLAAAQEAWQWALDNPDVAFENPADVSTGEYGDAGPFVDEFAWAAAELFITTEDPAYYDAFKLRNIDIWVPAWPDSRGLAWMSLAFHRDLLSDPAEVEAIEARILNVADTMARLDGNSSYRVAMTDGDFYWGSNGNVLNRAMMLLQGYRLVPSETRYLEAAQSLFDYILGRNPTGYSYVTGYGDKTPMHIHHRASDADDVEAPVPGFVAGGPNTDYPVDCEAQDISYPAGDEAIAKAYLDHWCSYSTNEVTINWNAPLVYVSGALKVMREDEAQ